MFWLRKAAAHQSREKSEQLLIWNNCGLQLEQLRCEAPSGAQRCVLAADRRLPSTFYLEAGSEQAA